MIFFEGQRFGDSVVHLSPVSFLFHVISAIGNISVEHQGHMLYPLVI